MQRIHSVQTFSEWKSRVSLQKMQNRKKTMCELSLFEQIIDAVNERCGFVVSSAVYMALLNYEPDSVAEENYGSFAVEMLREIKFSK